MPNEYRPGPYTEGTAGIRIADGCCQDLPTPLLA